MHARVPTVHRDLESKT